MLASLRSIVFFFEDAQMQSAIAERAAALAHHYSAHLIGVYRAPEPTDAYVGFARGEAIRDVIEQRMRHEEDRALQVSRRLRELSLKYGISIEFRVIDGSDAAIASQLIHCDLALLSGTAPDTDKRSLSVDQVLMAGGAPLLVIPDSWSDNRIGSRVVIAWNGSREARRAINDAMPFITASEWVKVLIVDAESTPAKFGADPGVDISHYLARHGANVEVQQLHSEGRGVAETIARFSVENGADLLVLGAYSRPRLGEILLGGVTRSFMAESPLPLLVSR